MNGPRALTPSGWPNSPFTSSAVMPGAMVLTSWAVAAPAVKKMAASPIAQPATLLLLMSLPLFSRSRLGVPLGSGPASAGSAAAPSGLSPSGAAYLRTAADGGTIPRTLYAIPSSQGPRPHLNHTDYSARPPPTYTPNLPNLSMARSIAWRWRFSAFTIRRTVSGVGRRAAIRYWYSESREMPAASARSV